MRTAAILLLLTTSAFAEEDKVTCFQVNGVTGQKFFECPQPDEATKQWALQRAYVINDGKMVRWDSIDVSNENPDTKTVKTVPIIPDAAVVEWTEKNMLDKSADVPYLRTKGDGVCYRHRMHKVTSSDGRSWRCRK
jgi:hypothetical protein